MHRISFWFFLIAALYVSGPACATPEQPAVKEKPVPHIALLLPLNSAAFGRAAEAVQSGFLAAASSQPQILPVRVYGCENEDKDIVALYRDAIANGARAVVGPLTRNGVAALAADADIDVPTLALNSGMADDADKLYFFGLTAEAEARQVAQLAITAGLRRATIVNSGTPLSVRLSLAFAEEWKKQGGSIAKEILYRDDPAVLADLSATPGDMVFLAAGAEKAHLLRPYLNITLPVYSTSQLFNGNADALTNYDLNEVRFVDMPWLLQPNHPAVMVYPRAKPPLTPDMERLYALGIDAFRLLQIMLDNGYRTGLPLDGVTGRIGLVDDRQFQREAIPALFTQGRGLTAEDAAALVAMQAAELAAAKAAAISGVAPAAALSAVSVP